MGRRLTAILLSSLLVSCAGPAPAGRDPGPTPAVSGPAAGESPSPDPDPGPTPSTGAGSPAPVDHDDAAATVPVVAVTDGDTLRVSHAGGVEVVRLIGIDAPESGECFAEAATDALRELVTGRRVTLVRDVSDRDRYGRLLRVVEVAGVDVNARLVRDGFALARAYPPDTARAEVYAGAQRAAEAAGAGRWGPDGCVSSRDDVRVTLRVEPDAPGDDNTNLNGEWLEIRNDAADPLVLDGFTVRDASASHRYTFAEGTTVPAGGTLVLFTGCGEDTATERYWCSTRSAVWNNAGDTASLLDDDGRTVATHTY